MKMKIWLTVLISLTLATRMFAGSADLKITVSVTPALVNVGDEIHYQCILTNQGPDTPSALHGYAGPDNTDGGCNPANPAVSCDKYTTFDQSTPSPFFTDSSNFRYFRMLLCTDSSCTATTGQVSTLSSGQSGLIDIFYKATTSGTTHRSIGVVSDDSSVTDPNQTNNSITYTFFIGTSGGTPTPTATATPTVSPGLSPTGFSVNGSTSASSNVADTVLRFAATQTGTQAGLTVRVQATTTPNTESSWTDINNGRGGLMTYDVKHGLFVLNSTDYPLQNGVYFRAVSSARNFPDGISNVVGPFNLASAKPHLPPTKLLVIPNSMATDFYFKTTAVIGQSGETFRIQASSNPSDESSWSDLPNGNAGHMTQSTDPLESILLMDNYPATESVFFRAVGSLSGFVDSITQPVGSFRSVSDVPPTVTITIPTPNLGGTGSSPDNPVILQTGFFSFGATAQSSQPLKYLALGIDGTILRKFENGETQGSIVTANTVGDHTLEALAVDKLGGRRRSGGGLLYVRIIPNTSTSQRAVHADGTTAPAAASPDRVFVAVKDGAWRDPATWNRNKGYPGDGGEGTAFGTDFAVIGSHTVTLTSDTPVNSVSMNGGRLIGNGANLSVFHMITIFGGSFENCFLNNYGVCELLNPGNVQFGGHLVNQPGAVINVHGAGGLVGADKFDNAGTVNWQTPLTPPLNALTDPLALVRRIGAKESTNSGLVTGNVTSLLTSDGASLIGHDGASLIGHDGASLIGSDSSTVISNDGGSIISHDSGTLITSDGASLIGHDGASLLTSDGAGLISSDGAGVVADHGGGFQPMQTATRGEAPSVAAVTSGYTQSGGGVIDLSHTLILGPATINGGSVIGDGIIAGNVTNNGYFSPGHSTGGITIIGNYTQSAQGTLILENGGATPDKYDRLNINGGASLNGKLDIRDINGYTPAATDKFDPIGFQSVSGTFSSVSSNAQITVTSTGVQASVNPNAPAPKPGQPLNISTRMQVLANDNALIAGFIVTGPSGSAKKVLIRGLGPSLANFGVPGTLSDPLLELHKPDNSVVTNDNWEQGDTSQIPSGFAPSDSRESVIVATLSPGLYTAVLRGAHAETGVGIAEVYDLDLSATQLANISTRGFVNTGDNVMIGGFIVAGSEPTKILVRAIGPSLTQFGIQGALPATTLELHDSNGSVLTNEGWRATQEAEIKATTIPPSDDNEAAILATLVPGNYTAVVRGKDNKTGIAVVEAYNLQ